MRKVVFLSLVVAAVGAQAQVFVPAAVITGGVRLMNTPGGVIGKIQYSPTNTNGASLDWLTTVVDWNGIFGDQGQYGMDAYMRLSTGSFAAAPNQTYQTRDWDGTTGQPTGNFRWAINNYAIPGVGPAAAPSSYNVTNSHFRGNDAVMAMTTVFGATFIETMLQSDGVINWYTVGQNSTPMSAVGLTGRMKLQATLVPTADPTWFNFAPNTTMALQIEAVPEPATMAALGVAFAAAMRKRRK